MSKSGDVLVKLKDSVLLLVDIQEKFAPVISGMEGVVRNAGILLQAAKKLGVPALASEQYPQALGRTVPELRLHMEEASAYFPKMCFSAVDCEPLFTRLHRTGRRRVLITGVESHVCVLQSAFAFMDKGFTVFVVADAVSSRREWDRDMALRRMEKHGVEIVTTEMVIFEWLRVAGTPEFKSVQALIK
jgi:isochorismate hydrolase